jgi:hypothetical protein
MPLYSSTCRSLYCLRLVPLLALVVLSSSFKVSPRPSQPIMARRIPAVAKTNAQLISRQTGAFKSLLPDVFLGVSHFKRAQKQLGTVVPDQKIANLRDRQRKFAAESLDQLMKGFCRLIICLVMSSVLCVMYLFLVL